MQEALQSQRGSGARHGKETVGMRYLIVFLFLVCLILWMERFYWRRRAQLLEMRILREDRSKVIKNLFDAWLDGRIEAHLQKRRNRA